MNIYVGNLSYEFSDAELERTFATYGKVKSAKVINDKFTGKSKGFGFVEMEQRGDGEKAIADLNGKEVRGRTIVVNEARPREEGGGGGRGPNFGGGGGGRGPRGGGDRRGGYDGNR